MDRADYTARVLAQLRHVTGEERAAIRAEIDGHMEDHVCALLDLGYDQALAEARTMSAMGDPAEVGRELNKQYPLGWLAVGRLAKLLALGLVLPILVSLLIGEGALLSCIGARLDPDRWNGREETAEATRALDIRQELGNDVLRVYRASRVGGQAEVLAVVYDRVPFGLAAEWVLDGLTLEDQRGEACVPYGGYGRDERTRYLSLRVPAAPGDTYVVLRCDRYGRRFAMEIPLPEVTP